MYKTTAFLTALAELLLILAASPAEARGGAGQVTSDSASVVVALVEELDGGPGVSAVLVRRAGMEPGDVILLRRGDANGTRLASAVAMLMLQRTSAPRVTRETRVQIQGAAVPAAWRANWLPRFENLVARLRRTDPRVTPGIGTVPTQTLVLPPAATRP